MRDVVLSGGPDDGKLLSAISWETASTISIDVTTTNKKGKTTTKTVTYTNTGKKDKNGHVIFDYTATA